MRLAILASLIAPAIFAPSAVGAAETVWPPETAPRQINVTRDSAPGWLPTPEQIAEVRKDAEAFFAAKDEGRAADAFALLADINKHQQTIAGFSDEVSKFNLQAGAARERRIIAVNWTKDPAQAPAPGVYVALDIVGRFANVDRQCGYLILYEAPGGGDFRVMREENNFMDNATAELIEKQHSRAEVDKKWAELSAHCPNYRAQEAPLPEQSASSIGYRTVAAALAGLHAKPGVEFSSQGGWTLATDKAASTMWSFVPPGDPAYPAAVKREAVQDGPDVKLQMGVRCESTKQACDDLVRKFEELNAEMSASFKGK